jgi:drug/metabolite transporter (DMT)-like permease
VIRNFIVGAALAALGAVILLRGINYQTTHDVVKIGDVHMTDTDAHGVPPWVGIATGVSGLLIIAMGAKKRK